jgi:membrane associated rhomboid family serine protease
MGFILNKFFDQTSLVVLTISVGIGLYVANFTPIGGVIGFIAHLIGFVIGVFVWNLVIKRLATLRDNLNQPKGR